MSLKQAFRKNFRDADLLKTIALPAAASTTVNTAALDLGSKTNMAIPPEDLVLCLKVPALSTTILPDTKTCTLTIEMSDDSAFGSGNETLRTATLTGAGGVGAAAAEIRAALPEDFKRYVRGKVAFGALTTDGSALSAELALLASGDTD